MHYASDAVLAIFEAMVDAPLAQKKTPAQSPRRGLYLGQLLPDGSRHVDEATNGFWARL